MGLLLQAQWHNSHDDKTVGKINEMSAKLGALSKKKKNVYCYEMTIFVGPIYN
jgi:hypothetical protein